MDKVSILLESFDKFFENEDNYLQLVDILQKQTVSMRKLESFVTKNKHLTIQTPNGETLNVNIGYKSCLNGYSKKLFDPFCRTDRITYKGIVTTVGQLNFIKWCIKNGILKALSEQLRAHQKISQ
jgi:hypothetical protein